MFGLSHWLSLMSTYGRVIVGPSVPWDQGSFPMDRLAPAERGCHQEVEAGRPKGDIFPSCGEAVGQEMMLHHTRPHRRATQHAGHARALAHSAGEATSRTRSAGAAARGSDCRAPLQSGGQVHSSTGPGGPRSVGGTLDLPAIIMPQHLKDSTRGEYYVDGVVHLVGVTGGAAAVRWMWARAGASAYSAWVALSSALVSGGAVSKGGGAGLRAVDAAEAAVLVYGFGLMAMLCASAAYNLLYWTRLGTTLRRFDHAAIFLKVRAGVLTLARQHRAQTRRCRAKQQ